jgi:nitroreductase
MQELRSEIAEHRTPQEDVDPLFLNRWSPRAMSGEPLSEEQYLPLFEAARWAPSSYNNQHWRFLYAAQDDAEFERFFNLLNEGNQAWTQNASVLVCLVTKPTFDHNGEPARTHSFDAGAAWQNLALEAARRELVAHAMQGFDYEAAAEQLNVPDEYDVECMIAIGERAPAETLPEDLQEREFPNQRKPMDEILFQGGFEA